jgi:Helix-turn-helix domain
MGTPKRRRSDRAGRPAMRSPGVRRWAGWSIVSGFGWRSRVGCRARMPRRRRACRPLSVSGGSGRVVRCRPSRSARGRGGTCRSPSARRSRSCVLVVCGVEIARKLGRSPSTISRELRRKAATRGGGFEYRAATAQRHAELRARRPKPRQARCEARVAPLCAGPAVRGRGAA